MGLKNICKMYGGMIVIDKNGNKVKYNGNGQIIEKNGKQVLKYDRQKKDWVKCQ